jgi:hypothetical protein
MESSRSSHSLYGMVNAMKTRGALDGMLMVPPMTPTVSTLAPFGATKEVVLRARTIFSRHVSTAAPSYLPVHVHFCEKFRAELLSR